MTCMLCRNRVSDFPRWKCVFDSHRDAHRNAGLELAHMWRDADDPNDVFFMFDVAIVGVRCRIDVLWARREATWGQVREEADDGVRGSVHPGVEALHAHGDTTSRSTRRC